MLNPFLIGRKNGDIDGLCERSLMLLGLIYICWRWTPVQTRIRIPNLMATLHYAERVHIAQTRTLIPTPYFCVRQESEFASVSETISDNVNEPLSVLKVVHLAQQFCFHDAKENETMASVGFTSQVLCTTMVT